MIGCFTSQRQRPAIETLKQAYTAGASSLNVMYLDNMCEVGGGGGGSGG
jgi:hypothetical protein